MRDTTLFSPHTAEYERLAESMGMDLQAFKAKYLTDPPFHALVVVHFAQERELLEALRETVEYELHPQAYGDDAVHLQFIAEEALLAQSPAGKETKRG